MRFEVWQLSFLIVPALILVHLWVAPYTKVEESFNIQAVHDFLAYGLPLRNAGAKIEAFYDHVIFPGAVPRTFIGAMALAGLSNPFIRVLDLDAAGQQMLGWYSQLKRCCADCIKVRGVLGMACAASTLFYTAGVRQAYGKAAAAWLFALQASQFHITFYATRTLPNTFAYAMSMLILPCGNASADCGSYLCAPLHPTRACTTPAFDQASEAGNLHDDHGHDHLPG